MICILFSKWNLCTVLVGAVFLLKLDVFSCCLNRGKEEMEQFFCSPNRATVDFHIVVSKGQ